MDGALNPFNGSSRLGGKNFHEPRVALIAASSDCKLLVLEAYGRVAEWAKTFPQANLLIDYLEHEARFGIAAYGEARWKDIELTGSIDHYFDFARNVSGTRFTGFANMWISHCFLMRFGYESQIGDSGLLGGGNSQGAYGRLQLFF